MIKRAKLEDLDVVTSLALSLWSSHGYEDLKAEMEKIILDKNAIVLIYFQDEKYIGFAQCQLRFDYVEGTKTSPVGYLEGVYVDSMYHRQGIAKKLLAECEIWAREKGCSEFASDCEIDNIESLNFHLGVGFIEANRNIHFKKRL